MRLIMSLSTRDSEEQYNKPRHTQGQAMEVIKTQLMKNTLKVKIKEVKKAKTTPKLNYDSLSYPRHQRGLQCRSH